MTSYITKNEKVGDFNSHPHEEDDEDLERDGAVDDISTHILTKRMTFIVTSAEWRGDNFNSHPHEEDDSASRSFLDFLKYFNSHPHEEDDENGS